jgi:hypothetical protein
MNSSDLIERIQTTLSGRLKQNTAACEKLWEIRKELEKLAKRVGKLESLYDEFSYCAPVRGGGYMVALRCYIDRDKVVMQYSRMFDDGKDTEEVVTHMPIEQIVSVMSHFLAHRIADAGVYKI